MSEHHDQWRPSDDDVERWKGCARMAAARLAAYGEDDLSDRDREALRRHPVCTKRVAALDVDGWGYVQCIRGVHDGACRYGELVHDDGAFRAEQEPSL